MHIRSQHTGLQRNGMLMKLIKRGLAALGIASLAIAPTTAAEARTNRGPAL